MQDLEKARRLQMLAIAVIVVIVFLLGRLAWMQLLQGAQYKKVAEDNRLRKLFTQGPRGTMYDRNGAALVSNRPSFAVSVIPAEYAHPQEVTPFLAELAGVPPAEIEALLASGQEFPYSPCRLILDANPAMIAKIEERKSSLPGVIIEALPVRYYVYGSLAAHVFGYIGRIDAEEYAARRGAGYNPSDLIGKDGLERVWEDLLRGVEGGQEIEVNARGEEVRVARQKPAVAGHGLVLTLDANLQKAAEGILAAQLDASRTNGHPAKGGAVVVLDVTSGAVLALASSPTYDPNVFARGISARDWSALLTNPNNPLTNRAIQSAYPPGSVFKIVTATAALDLGLVTPEEVFNDQGFYVAGGWTFYGWELKGLGQLKLVDAIAWSSDPVFYELGRRLGVDRLAAYALTYGLGAPSEIKLLGEVKGNVPTEAWKTSTYGEPWYLGETIIAAIGQGYYLVTPIQQALLLMAVANGGIIYRPYLVSKLLHPDGSPQEIYKPAVMRTVYLQPATWDTLRRGLETVVTAGTATSNFLGFPRPVAGKTGSAETGRDTVHSWFACYAPADKPQIVAVALLEDAGEGAEAAVPVVRKVLEAYFGLPTPGQQQPPPPGKSD